MDVDAELEELARALEVAQTADVSHKLSDRNVVELVLKLRQLGEVDVVFSLSGKEFVTPEQLHAEIWSELRSRGGRVRLDEVASALDLDLNIIEKFAKSLVESKDVETQDKDGSGVHDVQFLTALEIISGEFREAFCKEIDEVLRNGKPMLTLGEISADHGVPVEFARETINEGIAKGILNDARLHGHALRTRAYEEMIIAKVRGVLLGTTRPVMLSRVAQVAGVELVEVERLLVKTSLSKTSQSHHQHLGLEQGDFDLETLGQVRHGEFIPTSFANKQRNAVDSYFTQNQCLPYGVARSFHVAGNVATFVQRSFPDAFELSNCIISGTVIEAVESAILEIVSNRSWLDMLGQGVVPHQLTEVDLVDLVSKCEKGTTRTQFIGQRFVVSCSLLNAIQAHIEASAQGQAQASAARPLTCDEIIQEEFPQLDEQLLHLVVGMMKPHYEQELAKVRAEANSSVILSGATALFQRQSQLEASFSELYVELQLYSKGLTRLASMSTPAKDYLRFVQILKSRYVMPTAGLMVEHQCMQHGEPLEGDDIHRVRNGVRHCSAGSIMFNPAWNSINICRNAAEEKIPKESSSRSALLKLLQACEDEEATMDQMLELVQDAGRECCFVVRPADKKIERARVQARRIWLMDQILHTTSDEFLCGCACVLVLQQCKQIMLPEPKYPMEALDKVFSELVEPACSCLSQTPERQDDLRAVAAQCGDEQVFDRVRTFAALKNPAKGK